MLRQHFAQVRANKCALPKGRLVAMATEARSSRSVMIEFDEYCWRADALRETPAAVRFLSLEPLLGPLPSLDLTGID